MTSLIYNTGTVSVEHGSAIVEGNLTGWAVALVSGGLFSCAGVSIPILSVESDTALTLAYPWPGADASGKPYAIARDTSEATRAAWMNDRLATIIQRLSLVGIHPDGSGTLTERDALDPVPPTGYLWLYAEAGHDFAFYRKTASGWDGPFEVKGSDGDDGLPGAPGAAYEQYGITVYDGDGIAPGQWDADVYASADNVQDTLYAEIRGGDAGSEVDILIMVNGVGVHGPVRVAYGSPVYAGDIGVVIAEGSRVGVSASYVAGTVTDLAIKTAGAVA